MTATYRDFVRPAHPLVAELFGHASDPAGALDGTLAVLRQRASYGASYGHRSFDELHAAYRQTPEGRVPLNCLALSAILTSRLRAAGVPSDEVFVVLGSRRDYPPQSGRQELHAWTLVRDAGRLRWIDPASLEPEEASADAWLDRHSVQLLFNDQRVVLFPAEIRRLLAGPGADAFRVYLYGEVSAEARAAVQQPGVQRGLRSFFTGGRTAEASPFEGESDATMRAALACGALTLDGARYAPGPRLVLVNRRASRALRAGMDHALDRYLAVAAETIARLKTSYAACQAAERFAWPQVVHAVAAGMFLDLAVGARLGLAAALRREQGGHVVWAFEEIESVNGYGVVWAEYAQSRTGVAQLWHRTVRRKPMPGDAIPVFGPQDTARLIAPLSEGADRLVAEAVTPILDLASRHSSWQHLRTRSSLTQAVARLVLEYGVDRVIDAGLIDPFPAGGDMPAAWGRWMWREPAEGPSLIPWATAAPEPRAVAS